jgi:hypothetical protein
MEGTLGNCSIPLADLLATKFQVVEITERDIVTQLPYSATMKWARVGEKRWYEHPEQDKRVVDSRISDESG